MSKLLLIGPSPSRAGGVATYLRHLTSSLSACAPGEWAAFSTDKSGGGSGPERIVDGLRVARRLRKNLKLSRSRLAHICCGSDNTGWGLREGLLHARMARRAGLRVLLHLHASALPELLSPVHRESGVLLAALQRVDAIAVPAESSAELLVERGLRPEGICVVPNAVPILPWQSQASTKEGPLRLLIIGTIEERKGFDVLLDALELLHQDAAQPLTVDAYGPCSTSPETLVNWESRGAALGLKFHGPASPATLQKQLLASDGLLLPSHAECQPFVLLEAMAAGKPVIASRIGGIERLLQGGAGKLIPPGKAKPLADALLRWRMHPEERTELARAGWERVREKHSLEKGMSATLKAWKAAAGAELWETDFSGSALTYLGASPPKDHT